MSSDNQSGDASELSIEETNKLRIKLGLKPLEVDSGLAASSSQRREEKEKSYTERGEVFVKTESIADKIEAEKLREKFAVQREKRLLAEKLKSVKTIVDEIEDDDLDPFAWVNKSRDTEQLREKKLEEDRKRELAQRSASEEETIKRQRLYNESHIKGLRVNHAIDSIQESQSIILTLRDRDVLDEQGEDELENVNLKDEERARENISNKKHGTRDYNPYETQESLLSKYDDKVADSFRISGHMAASSTPSQNEHAADAKVSLNTLQIKFASEFYTPEEMEAKFKKRKKKGIKKVSLRNTTSDALLDDALPNTEDNERGNKPKRKKQNESSTIGDKDGPSVTGSSTKIKKEPTEHMPADESIDQDLDNYFPGVIDDEAETELQEALEKVRRRKQPVVPLADLLSSPQESSDMNDPSTGSMSYLSASTSIILDSTAEFCRTLGETSSQFKTEASDNTSKTTRTEEEGEMMDMSGEHELEDGDKTDFNDDVTRRRRSRRERHSDDDIARNSNSGKDKWTEIKVVKDDSTFFEKLKSQPILEEEPDASLGVASALQLAFKKGYLEKEAKKSASVPAKHPELMAKGYSIEEKFRDDDRRGHRGENRGYSNSSSLGEFKEKSNYEPDVKLEYVDDNGRLLNQKEAFRVLSHKFHGKGPGKNKVDKRMKKLEQESKLRQMSCIDTPLNTLHKLQEKQKELQLPYVVISGSGSTLVKK